MLDRIKDRALAAWVRLQHGAWRAAARLKSGDRGDILQQAVLWALIVVVAIGVLVVIGTRVVAKLQAINNALS